MDRKSCLYEKISDVSVGVILVVFGLGLTAVSLVILPVVGLFIAIPVLVLAVAFLTARRSKACALLVQKTKRAVSTG